MSHSFDALEMTLRQLTEIVERNHSHQETSNLVKQMTSLIDEIKVKTGLAGSSFPPPISSMHKK